MYRITAVSLCTEKQQMTCIHAPEEENTPKWVFDSKFEAHGRQKTAHLLDEGVWVVVVDLDCGILHRSNPHRKGSLSWCDVRLSPSPPDESQRLTAGRRACGLEVEVSEFRVQSSERRIGFKGSGAQRAFEAQGFRVLRSQAQDASRGSTAQIDEEGSNNRSY